MIQSVGTLYAIQDLFDHLGAHRVEKTQFLEGFSKYGASTAQEVYQTAVELSWICVADNGQLIPTEIGRIANQGVDRPAKLRFQLANIIESKRPVWAGLLPKGRKEAEIGLPDEIRQCLDEALLFGAVTDEIVDWWDKLAGIMREVAQRKNIETGRRGERLSIRYETERTSRAPQWKAIETNYAGYDVLSVQDKVQDVALKIEVKASERAFKNATIHVTEHEWITASKSMDSYVFHIWLLDPSPTLFIIPSSTVVAHIPKNQGKGTWKNACIPMGSITHPSKGISLA